MSEQINKPVIRLKNISKIYGKGRAQINALKDVSLDIDQGKIITIMGPSGSGKSTMLNLLGAMDKPTSGEVLVDDKDVGSMPERKLFRYRKETIGFVFQDFYLLPNLDVINNILLPLVPYGIKQKDRDKAQELLDKVGLGTRGKSKVNKLSGGEQQRIAIARALINNPKVILADEPTGNLDSETGKSIIELFFKLVEEEKKTIVIVTHDPNIAAAVGDHPSGQNVWIKDGVLSKEPTYNLFCWG